MLTQLSFSYMGKWPHALDLQAVRSLRSSRLICKTWPWLEQMLAEQKDKRRPHCIWSIGIAIAIINMMTSTGHANAIMRSLCPMCTRASVDATLYLVLWFGIGGSDKHDKEEYQITQRRRRRHSVMRHVIELATRSHKSGIHT